MEHIYIWNVFMTDIIISGDLQVEYFPIEMMWGDYNIKPLWYKLLCVFRIMILNLHSNDNNLSCEEITTMDTNKNVSDHEKVEIPVTLIKYPRHCRSVLGNV